MGIIAKPIIEVEVYRDIPIYIHRYAIGMECSVRNYWISSVNTKHFKLEYLNEWKQPKKQDAQEQKDGTKVRDGLNPEHKVDDIKSQNKQRDSK